MNKLTRSSRATIARGILTLLPFAALGALGSNAIAVDSRAVVAGSQAVGVDSKAVVAGSQAVVAGSQAVVAGSQAVVAGSQPVVAGSNAVVAGSQAVVAGSNAVVADSQAVVAGSQPVAVDSNAVVAGINGDYPGTAWRVVSPEEADMDPVILKKAIDYAFTYTGDEKERTGVRTDGLVIIRHGALVLEQYARGYTPETRHLAWSVTKSFVNALYGIAVKDGKLKVQDSASKYYPALDTSDKHEITLDQLLHMSSGLYWREGYEASPLDSTVIAMLYTYGRQDMGAYAASLKVQYKPGTHWYYSSGTTNILSSILKNVLGEPTYASYPWERLFDKIGMTRVTWERDQAGVFVGSSYLYATPRDLARFGYLYLKDGVWAGERILPEGWVDYTTKLAPAYASMELTGEDRTDNPGAHWWLNVGVPDRGIPRPWPDVPSDCYAAEGHWGQDIFVCPSLDMVVVRTADDRDGSFKENTLLKLIIESIRKSG